MFNRIYTHLCFFPFLSSFFVILLIMNKSNTHQDTPPYTSKKTGKQCAVHGCQNCYFKDKGLSAGYYSVYNFFSFPTETKTRNCWCNLIKRQHGKDDFNVTAANAACSEHFRQEDIVRKLPGSWDLKVCEIKILMAHISLLPHCAKFLFVPLYKMYLKLYH